MLADDRAARGRLAMIVASMMLFFGILLAYVTPPLQAPDEAAHFYRVAMLSEGQLWPEIRDGVEGARLPLSLQRFKNRHDYLMSDREAKYDYGRIAAEMRAPAQERPRVFSTTAAQATSPLMYLPSLAGVGIGSLLMKASFVAPEADNWATMHYFARIGNLVGFAIAVALALVALPRFHAVVAFVALMPMTMFLSAAIQYDSMTWIACLAIFAVVVRRATLEGAFTGSEFVALGAAAFVLGHGKVVYLPLLLAIVPVLFMVPRRSAWQAFGIAVVFAILGGLGTLVFKPLTGTPMDAARQQVAFLLDDLGNIPGLIARTVEKLHGFYFGSLFGHFGPLDTVVPPSLLLLVWAAFLLAIFNDSRGPVRRIGFWLRLAAGLGVLIAFVGIMLSLYVIWTSRPEIGAVGAPTIIGVQGRYFIPFLPFVALIVSFNLRRFAPRFAGAMPDLLPIQLTLQAAALGVVLFILLLRYWI